MKKKNQDLEVKKVKRKKNSKLDITIMIIIFVGWIFVSFLAYKTYILKPLYRATIILGVASINFLFVFISKLCKKLIQRRIVKFILLALVLGQTFAGLQVSKALQGLENVVSDKEEATYILSLKSANFPTMNNISDFKNYRIGYNLDESNYLKYKLPMKKINVKENTLIPFSDDDAMLAALYSNQVDFIIMDHSYKSTLVTKELYKNRLEEFNLNFKILTDLKKEKTPELNITEPTSFILAGIDAEKPGVLAGRNDAVLVVTVNPSYKSITITALQRDLYVEQPCFDNSKDKYAHAFYNGDAYSYQGGGAQCLIDTTAKLLDIKIDRFVAINFKGFVEVINAIGGIEMTLDPNIYPNGLTEQDSDRNPGTVFIPNGTSILNGEQALAFARNRYGLDGGANKRASNQGLVMAAVMEKIGKSDLLTINKIIDVGVKSGNSATSVQPQDITPFANLAFSLFGSEANITQTTLSSSSSTDRNGASVEIPNKESLERLKNILKINMGVIDPELPMYVKYPAYMYDKAYEHCNFDYSQSDCYDTFDGVIGLSLEYMTKWWWENGFDANNVAIVYVDENKYEPGVIIKTENKYFYRNYPNIIYVER